MSEIIKELHKRGKYLVFQGKRDQSGSFYIRDTETNETSGSFPTGTKNWLIKQNDKEFEKAAKNLLSQVSESSDPLPTFEEFIGEEDKWIETSHVHWQQILHASNGLSPRQRSFYQSIVDYARKHGKVSKKQYAQLQRLKSGRVNPEDYHPKN